MTAEEKNEKQKVYYKAHKEERLSYAASYRAAHRKVIREKQAIYARTVAGKAAQAKAELRRRKLYPERVRARRTARRAIGRGVLLRGPCASCGTSVGVQAHHSDYARPMDIQWLCQICHKLLHSLKPMCYNAQGLCD